LIIVIIKKLPNKDESIRKDIAKYEDELEEIRTAMAKALADNFMPEYHVFNIKRQRVCKALRRLRARLKTDSPD